MSFHHLNTICFERSHFYFRNMSPTYVHRSNLYSDRHLPFPIVFLSLSPFFFQCGWHKNQIKVKFESLVMHVTERHPLSVIQYAVYYLKISAGSFFWALSCSTSFGKFFQMKIFPDEGIPSWVHSSSVEACFSSKIEFSDCKTASTWSNKNMT